MSVLYFSLGSNIAPRLRYLRRGLKSLEKEGIKIEKVSSVYRTSPVEVTAQPYYLNAAAKARTKLSPLEILRLFKTIEKQSGRGPGPRFAPRTLDLDLLLYNEVKMKSSALTLPHPRMEKRKFVLIPLLEINSKLKNLEGVPYRFFLQQASSDQIVRKEIRGVAPNSRK